MTRLIDADALMEFCSNQKSKTISNNDIARFPTAPTIAEPYSPYTDIETIKEPYTEDDYWNGTAVSGDLISRAEAVGYIDRVTNSGLGKNKSLDYIRKYIERMPSVSAERVGEWIEVEDYNGDIHYQCSNCKEEFYLEYGTPKENEYHFCPNCGARMED